jgi:carboxyl-terminal processing protease
MTIPITRRVRAQRPRHYLALAALLSVILLTPRLGMAAAPSATPGGPACSADQPQAAPPFPPPTMATIAEAYSCLLAHYPTGDALDDRVLLHGAMVGLVSYLLQQGLDQPDAVLPALTGNRSADWQAFRQTYVRIAARLPHHARVQQGLVRAAITGLVASLHDDHTGYAISQPVPTGPAGGGPARIGLGLRLSTDGGPIGPTGMPLWATAPLFILAADPGSPAARAGLRPGDVITAIDGLPPFVGGQADQVVLGLLHHPGLHHLSVRRPVSGRARTVAVTAASYPQPEPQAVTARRLPGDVAYVRLAMFVPNAANYVIAGMDGLGLGANLRGLVLDLRGNGGGAVDEPPRLLGAFIHHAIFAYYEDGHGHRTPQWTDATMPLVHVPLVVLIDGRCASACDVTAGAIRDLHLGRLVGERTAGVAGGPASPWFLDDGSALFISGAFMRGADGEIVDGIGVPPDVEVPMTAAALSASRDPGLDEALRDLRGTG